MEIPLSGLFLVICLAALLMIRYFTKTARVREDVYTTAGPPLAPHELALLAVLERTLHGTYRILPKLRMSDIVIPSEKLSSQRQLAARRHADRFSLTFALCEQPQMKVIAVIVCGEQPGTADEYVYVQKVLAANGIPLVSFKAKPEYYLFEVWVKLSEACPGLFAQPPASIRKVAVQSQPPEQITCDTSASPAATETSPRQSVSASRPEPPPAAYPISPQAGSHPCPACSGTMIRRQVMKGIHTGKFFRVCSNFPTCRQMIALPDVPEPSLPAEQASSPSRLELSMTASRLPAQTAPAGAAPTASGTTDTPVQQTVTTKPMLLTAAVTAQPVSAMPAAVPMVESQHDQTCPACGKQMNKMQVAKGAHAGKFFWACSGFPACRQLAAITDQGA